MLIGHVRMRIVSSSPESLTCIYATLVTLVQAGFAGMPEWQRERVESVGLR